MKHLSWPPMPRGEKAGIPRSGVRSLGCCARPRAVPLRAVCLLACIALVLTAFGAVAVSGASFAWGSGNPANTFSSGAFTVLNSADGGYVLDIRGLRPGQAESGLLTLTCQGDFAGTMSLTNRGITDTPASPALSTALTLSIEDVTGPAQTLWSGTMSTFASLTLGQFSAGETRNYRLTVAFPQSAATPRLQGATTTMSLRFSGVAL